MELVLLIGAVKRLQGTGGDPVVHLQTNFGGGKTHSMLALYHLCSETKPTDLLGIDRILHKAGADSLPRAKRVVLVGNKLSPGNPLTKPDGTVVRTLWGELAWQLGEQEAFERIRLDDERATNPGDALRELFDRYGPCLVLIDEWVAYARQLHDQPDLPGGTFDTQFTFAQSLTEAAKSATQALVVISLPASDSGHSPHASADDLEVGGDRGREALVRLRNVIGRLESSWKPATSEEGFEIVRRRLFEPILDPRHYVERDNVVRAFYEFYRTNPGEFPSECGKADYEKRLRDAYPIHPEVFDRLYNDWSTLVRFQRTRGVLRLMAAVIHHLWEQGDKSPMILPASIPIGDPRIQSELTRYLPDNWSAVIEKDVDGPNSLPRQIDEVQNLGRFSATRRVARTIYLGSAPIAAAANLGIEDRRIRLGCVMPGEQIAVFGDALRRLAANATYLYEDPPRYWYSTQPTVAKLAEDRAELLKREPDKIAKALEASLKRDLQKDGGFGRIHLMPATASDVGDELECGLVVFGPDHAHVKDGPSAAELKAKEILESRGNAPRLNRNTLVFLAPDKARYQDLEDALRRFLAWDSILTDAVELQLTPHQVKQALTQRESFESAVRARLPEGYQWALVPVQTDQAGPVTWEVKRVTGGDPLAVRVSKKLKNEELLFPSLGGVRLRMELDRVPLWRGGNHVALRQLVEDFARYVYLPRLMGPLVLAEAAASGVALLTWPSDGFAYAESYDEATGRYRGLRAGHQTAIGEADPGLLVRADAARVQIEAEAAVTPPGVGEPTPGSPTGPATETPSTEVGARLTRFHGTVVLDPERVGRDAGRVAEEVIAHLTGILGAQVEVVLEIEARIPQGVSDPTVRTVTENARTLRFRSHGFEGE